jgi:DNA repair exonuclease SbcCD ATPase subunit
MLTFRKLTICHFKAFRRKQTFFFPTKPGFYQFAGRNKLRPELGANATGKSSLWDALSWVLYGKTARGLKAGDISTWKVRGTPTVRLVFIKDKAKHTLTRTWNPNSLILNGETVNQEQIDSLIGLTYNAFLATVLMSQFGEMFFNLSATAKLSVFSNILNLQLWLDLSRQAGNIAKETEIKVQRLQLDIAGKKSEYRLIKQQIKDERQLAAEWETKQRVLILDAKQALFVARNKQSAVDLELEKTSEDFKELPKVSDDKQLRDSANNARRSLDCKESEIAATENKISELKQLIVKLRKGAEEKRCPLCGTNLTDAEHLTAEKERVLGEFATLGVRLGKLSRQADKLHMSLKRAQRLVDDTAKQNAIATKMRNEVQQRLSNAKYTKENATRAVTDAQKQLNAARNAANVHAGRIKTLKANLNIIADQWNDAFDSLGKLDVRQKGFEYWHKEFKNLRLWLIEESLAELEIEVNNSLLQLGLKGWRVTFAVEKVTKSGTVSKGFAVFIQSPDSPKRVKWQSWSGGETSRLLIASALGLSRLIRNRYGVDSFQETWDEPLSMMSVEGKEMFLSFFRDRSVDEQKQIFLISHETQSTGVFDGRFEVVMGKNGAILRKPV